MGEEAGSGFKKTGSTAGTHFRKFTTEPMGPRSREVDWQGWEPGGIWD